MFPENMDFEGKCVIVTGSSNGIGRGTAVEFARRGANVLIHGRDPEAISETVKLCHEVATDKAKFPTVKGDITDEDIAKEIATTAKEQLGRIDILINNAGASQKNSLLDNITDFDRQIRLKIRAPLLLSQLCFPELKKVGGNILNVSSIGSTRPAEYVPFYCIGKAALDMFTKCAALEFGSQGVRINSINPGLVDTSAAKVHESEDENEQFKKIMSSLTPLDKIVTVQDVAKMIAFIVSESASMMNGACVVLDGGFSLIGLDTKTLQNAAK